MNRLGRMLVAGALVTAVAGPALAEDAKNSTRTPAGATTDQLRSPDVLAPTDSANTLDKAMGQPLRRQAGKLRDDTTAPGHEAGKLRPAGERGANPESTPMDEGGLVPRR